MKVKLLHNSEIVEAKRFKAFTEEEIEESTSDSGMWCGEEIFVKDRSNHWNYMFDDEIEILEE
jgi:hypothetical protein